MSFIKEKELFVKQVLKNLNYESDVVILPSSKKELGDFQINASMSLAKKYHKNPMLIANEIVSHLDSSFCDVNIIHIYRLQRILL